MCDVFAFLEMRLFNVGAGEKYYMKMALAALTASTASQKFQWELRRKKNIFPSAMNFSFVCFYSSFGPNVVHSWQNREVIVLRCQVHELNWWEFTAINSSASLWYYFMNLMDMIMVSNFTWLRSTSRNKPEKERNNCRIHTSNEKRLFTRARATDCTSIKKW